MLQVCSPLMTMKQIGLESIKDLDSSDLDGVDILFFVCSKWDYKQQLEKNTDYVHMRAGFSYKLNLAHMPIYFLIRRSIG